MISASVAETTLTTNSFVSNTLSNESFWLPSRRLTGQNKTEGGFAPMPLKKLYGARLVTPSLGNARHPRDWSRSDQLDHQRINVADAHFSWIELHF